MKKLIFFVLLFIINLTIAQDLQNFEKPPVYKNCEGVDIQALQNCFNNSVYKHIFNEFKVPQVVTDENYKGEVAVLFGVDKEGQFQVIYIDATYNELKDETNRVFRLLPKIKPGTYNGRPTYKQYSMSIAIPLVDQTIMSQSISKENKVEALEKRSKNEIDSINAQIQPYTNNEYKSKLNIPFTHSFYSRFDRSMNLIGSNSHTASKPLMYDDVSKYYNLEEEKEGLKKEADNWWKRKLWNEHLVQLQGKDYWFTIDPIFDLQVGKDTDADFNSTYNNTRGFYVQGGLGKKFNFFASVYESQGRFAQYVNQYSESLGKPGSDTEVAVIPGRGIAKRFKKDSYDYPVAEAYLSYSPANFINIQFGHGKNFIGDGYRSLLQSDVASPYPFLKLNTKFWKIKYTNTWNWLKDIRPEVEEDGAFLTKYIANHYLSWNVSKKFNLGLFESVMWTNSNDRGFDINYLNPVIFYRAIEFETGQDAGNAILGASAKYKWNDNINFYGQFILDEFSLDDITGGDKSWKNKYGYQLGAKYYNAFKVKNLMLQVEYNQVRPYTYSHNTIVLNYAHNNQSMAHLWGANFKEFILIGRYFYKRWSGDAKVIFGQRGLDFNNGTDNFNYGGDIFRSENQRPSDTGIEIGQGNKVSTINFDVQGSYLINPATNLKLFANISYRNFDPEAETVSTFKNNTVWFNIGLRTDLFNWYFDF